MPASPNDPFLSEPQAVHRLDDEQCGLTAFLVLHDTTLGPAFGGIRFRAYPDDEAAREDAVGLARQMTWKCSLAGMDGGGGKAAVRADCLKDRRAACLVLGDFIESLGGAFRTAGDLGATRRDIEIIASRTRYIVGPEDLSDLGDAAAIGLVAAMEALCPRLGKESVASLEIAVQGLGDIGFSLARRLVEKGARPYVADLDDAALCRARELGGLRVVPPAEIARLAVDVFSPCAVGGVIDARLARELSARAVVGGANRVLADREAGEILWRRRIWYAPDFLVNAGAVIRGGLGLLRGVPGREDEIARIGPRLARLFDEAERLDLEPERLAVRWAVERIRRARG